MNHGRPDRHANGRGHVKSATTVRRTSSPGGEIAPGTARSSVAGREIGIFNVKDEFFALINRCPHEGAPLCIGPILGRFTADRPGEYRLERHGEMLRCPWHGWEFDIKTGQSWCHPESVKARTYRGGGRAGRGAGQGTVRGRDGARVGRAELRGGGTVTATKYVTLCTVVIPAKAGTQALGPRFRGDDE